MPGIIRTSQNGCFQPVPDPWGTAYERVADPLAEVDGVPKFVFNGPKLPRDQWTRIVKLFDYLCDPNNDVTQGTCEVQVVLALNLETGQFRCFVPKQQVDGVTVEADMAILIDLETGELCEGIPEGWAYAGTVHSHNTMSPQWSRTDDEDQLKNWGLHLVVGSMTVKDYAANARITRKNQVIDLKWLDVVESLWLPEAQFHKDVLLVIEKLRPKMMTRPLFGGTCWEFACSAQTIPSSLYCQDHQVSKDDPKPEAQVIDLSTLPDKELIETISMEIEHYADVWHLEALDDATANALIALINGYRAEVRDADHI